MADVWADSDDRAAGCPADMCTIGSNNVVKAAENAPTSPARAEPGWEAGREGGTDVAVAAARPAENGWHTIAGAVPGCLSIALGFFSKSTASWRDGGGAAKACALAAAERDCGSEKVCCCRGAAFPEPPLCARAANAGSSMGGCRGAKPQPATWAS